MMTLDILVLARTEADYRRYPLERRMWQLHVAVGPVTVPVKVYGDTHEELCAKFAEALGGLVRGAKP